MRIRNLVCVLLIWVALIPAKTTVIKLATLAPQGSDMYNLMVEMGQAWTEATDGAIKLRIYPNGVVGDERDMIRKIRVGQIHAAAVTTEGLSVVSTDVYGFLVPLLFDDFEDVDWVRNRIAPQLEQDFADNGFVILNWGDVGWAYWFSREPLLVPSDLEDMSIFTWAGDYHTAKLWKQAGFESVQLAYLDVLSGLQTGLIDALATPSIMALSNQFFGPADHMLDMKWGLVTGGTIIDKRIWDRINTKHQQKMLTIARKYGVKQQAINRNIDDLAIATMLEHGLTVHEPNPQQMEQWVTLTRSFYPLIRGSLIPAGIFDKVVALKAEKDSLDLLDE